MEDLYFFDLLPEDVWLIIISYLPRISRKNLAKIKLFENLVESKIILKISLIIKSDLLF